MVSQPHYSAIFIYRSDALPLLHNITCTKFFQNFVQKESNRLTFGAVALIFILSLVRILRRFRLSGLKRRAEVSE